MRLIDQVSKKLSLKNWIEQHNPKEEWDWDNPHNLLSQFIQAISETGDIDLKTLFSVFESSGLSEEQEKTFSSKNY